MAVDLPSVGAAVAATIVSIGTIVGGGYAWWLRSQRDHAAARADVAESNADRTVADAQQTVYKMLTERMSSLEGDVRGLRAELALERRNGRRLALHIWKLETLMRSAGLEPPPFHEASPALVLPDDE